MVKSGLSRLFSSLSEQSIVKLSSASFISESVTRFVCASAQQYQFKHGKKADDEDREAVKGNLEPKIKEEEAECGDEEDHVNKETGEVGGLKGREPTLYRDWERNGR
ncbi:Detected protein of unknown function [Hibiscus syriacus]|uniref:Succinate dehydrogenase assembly factor 4, mitochondrial n=1 Tax=Hibiscus syriacus TaxID=106335 RepID=A0A6A3A687_HIBSY|nr:succinate dehydrogenase assembly factor 4, mitochondrial-like [Hibiscus syriacus]KAE8699821.1 Detected protein of unknown function [Hibiscus syriacus]